MKSDDPKSISTPKYLEADIKKWGLRGINQSAPPARWCRTVTALFLGTSFLLSACSDAQKSSEVTTAYVATSNYSSKSCKQLRSESDRLRRSVPELAAAVDREYKKDKNLEAVAWVLFWPAALAMDGNDEESTRLSHAKGEADAIKSAMQARGCRL